MNADNQRVSISTYIPAHLARRIEREAQENDRSVSSVIRIALLRHFSGKREVELRESAQ